MRQNTAITQLVDSLSRSLYGQQLVNSLTAQLLFITETANLNGLQETRAQLIPASYHRVTALGSALRVQRGDNAPTLFNVLENSINLAEQNDVGVRAGLDKLLAAAPPAYNEYTDSILQWQQYTENHLQDAKRALEQIVGPGAQ